MEIYNRLKDEMGNKIEGRAMVFIPQDKLESDGTIGDYILSEGSVVNQTGYTFIINESDSEKLAKCKMQNGVLIYEP